MTDETTLVRLVRDRLGDIAAAQALEVLEVPEALLQERGERVSRAVISYAMTTLLMHDLLDRVPTGAAYVEDLRREGRSLMFDHGALRTIAFGDAPTGQLPCGEQAFRRLLEPLGYHEAGLYPLERLKMTGRAYAHRDLPADIPQFFVSELHVEAFSTPFVVAAHRVFDSATDPLGERGVALLASLAEAGSVSFSGASELLPLLVGCFTRTHATPALEDYEQLRAESAEAAWIATEGWAFNHVTDRVADLDAVVARQQALGRPLKEKIEVSRSGRVRQTAFRADPVEREFAVSDGLVTRTVPGSFYEFIARDHVADAEGQLDLAFDTGNAQGIFKMTS